MADPTPRQDAQAIAYAFLAAVAAGDLPDALLTPDMTAWLTGGRVVDRETYRGLIRLLDGMCMAPLVYTLDAITAQDDRVVIEARSSGTLIDGQAYANTYVFVLRVADGRIARVAEHYDAIIARERLVPLMQAARERAAPGVEARA